MTDMDGFTFPLGYTDEGLAQDIANCVMSSLGSDYSITGEFGVFLDYIETPGTNPNQPYKRYVHWTYYY